MIEDSAALDTVLAALRRVAPALDDEAARAVALAALDPDGPDAESPPLEALASRLDADDEAASCAATADLTLDWDVTIGGTLHPMASQTIGGLDLAADLYRGDDLLVLDVAAHADGLVWSYLDVVTLSDLDVWFRSYDRIVR